MNRQKSYVLVNGRGVKPTHVAGLEVRDRVRYLDVLLGHNTAAESYAPARQETMLRAQYVATLPMTLVEKCLILKVWIAPCCHLIARTYFPIPHVVSQLNMIQRVALRLTSLGLTRDILVQPKAIGGFGQAGMGTYALCPQSKSFVQYMAPRSSVPATLSEGFGRWVHSQGLVCNEVTLPYIQLAPSSAQRPELVGGGVTQSVQRSEEEDPPP